MELKVDELLGTKDLALRVWADELFTLLAAKNDKTFILDFSNIKFMSRSFANEYLSQKKNFEAKIRERNIDTNLKKMFDVADHLMDKKEVHAIRASTIRSL
ncbi:MAG: STAS-like domain-containing protein [Thermoplasmatales archaeon]|nr:STAS-like domain-containing protein [Thermoplasmatales archaeon]MCW6170330.1 STAS-like domain-containing protein [Thermoplasmatales archaeon]